MSLTPKDLLAKYERRINRHDFGEMVPLIAPDAVFWFSDGSHVGIDAIRAAFERTWEALQNDTYWLDEVRWIAEDDEVAACIYRFNWRTTIKGQPASGSGRGTTVMRKIDGRWQIVHEHLSADG